MSKKIIHILFLAFFPMLIFAQGGNDTGTPYVLEPGKTQQIPVVLQGPD